MFSIVKGFKSLAFIDGRDYVIPDDVKRVAVDVLAHRIILKVEYAVEGVKPEEVVKDVLKEVKVPKSI